MNRLEKSSFPHESNYSTTRQAIIVQTPKQDMGYTTK